MRTVIMLSFVVLTAAVVAGSVWAMPEPGDSVYITTLIDLGGLQGAMAATYSGDLVDMTDDFTCIDCFMEHIGENITFYDNETRFICLGNDFIYEITYMPKNFSEIQG